MVELKELLRLRQEFVNSRDKCRQLQKELEEANKKFLASQDEWVDAYSKYVESTGYYPSDPDDPTYHP